MVLPTDTSFGDGLERQGRRRGPIDDPERYAIGELLASGGEGQVFAGTAALIQDAPTAVAIKVLHAHLYDALGPGRQRWMRQAQLLKQVRHDRLVRVIDVFEGPSLGGSDQSTLFLVMELLEGPTLEQWLDAEGDPHAGLAHLARIASALDYLHSGEDTGRFPIVHHDVKPQNIVITDTGPVLIDFGSALATAEAPPPITPPYCPPEGLQSLGLPTWDAYSVAAIAWTVLVGTSRPYELAGPEARAILRATSFGQREGDRVDLVAEAIEAGPADRPTHLENWVAALINESVVPAADRRPSLRVPYKGLRTFSAEDASYFFGRQRLTERLAVALASHGVVTLAGASGSGKSSLVRAGLLPTLARARATRPVVSTPGNKPMRRLLREIVAVEELDEATSSSIDESEFALDVLLRHGGDARTVVVVDQFEEFFALEIDESERNAFRSLLVLLSNSSEVDLVLTVRIDFSENIAADPDLAQLLSDGWELIGPMTPSDVRDVVEGPAQMAGCIVEPGLVDRVIRDAGSAAGALPMISHALEQTWLARTNNVLSHDAYDQVGGVQSAITAYADGVVDRMLGAGQAELAKQILLSLVTIADNGIDSARARPLSDFDRWEHPDASANDKPDMRSVVQILSDRRLVTIERDEVRLAHEALMRNWSTFEEWIAEHRHSRETELEVAAAVDQWFGAGRDDSYLLSGLRLQRALLWRSHRPIGSFEVVDEFIDRSNERDRKRGNVRRLSQLMAMVMVALVAIGLGYLFRSFSDGRSNEAARKSAAPTHSIELVDDARRPFLIDAHEVTYRQYDICVTKGRSSSGQSACSPLLARWDIDNPSAAVRGVSAAQASAFCAWRGGSLPTHAEWTTASKQGGEWPWPTGSQPDGLPHVNQDEPVVDATAPLLGAEEYAIHLVGNLSEWTSTVQVWTNPDEGGRPNEIATDHPERWSHLLDSTPFVPDGHVLNLVIVGRSYDATTPELPAGESYSSRGIEYLSPFTGFRCVD